MGRLRAFYKVDQSNWPPPEDPDTGEPTEIPDAIVIAVTTRFAYLHSAVYPNPVIEALGGEFLAHTWTELHGALAKTTAKGIFRTEVDREETIDGKPVTVRHSVRMNKKRTGDVAVRENLVPHAWGRAETIEEQAALDAAIAT